MSKITLTNLDQCNFCKLRGMRARARKSGNRLTLLKARWSCGGWNIYIHPNGVDIKKLCEEGTSRKAYWHGWLAAVGKKCEC